MAGSRRRQAGFLCGADRGKNFRGWQLPPCKIPVKKEDERCRFHQGKEAIGITVALVNDTTFSVLPPAEVLTSENPHAGILKRYETLRADPRLVDLRDSLAWLAAVREDLTARLPNCDSPGLRVAARDHLKRGEVDEALELLENGVTHDRILKQITDLAEREGALAGRAADLVIRSENTLSVKQVIGLCQKVIGIVADECPKAMARKIVARVQQELVKKNTKLALAASEYPLSGQPEANGNGAAHPEPELVEAG